MTPTTVFIDTCIYEREGFNFESSVLTAFKEAVGKHGLKLVVPSATRDEVVRHMEEKAADAYAALVNLRHKYVTIRRWPKFPQAHDSEASELVALARAEWTSFTNAVRAADLGYEDVDVAVLMDLYNRQAPPFGAGKKRKEFPDAVAFLAVAKFAEGSAQYVAVVSCDGDMRAACKEHRRLVHFDSLAAYVNSLLAGDERRALAEALLPEVTDQLDEQVREAFADLTFVIDVPRAEVTGVEVQSLEVDHLDVVGLGEGDFIVNFEATLEFVAEYRRALYPKYGDYTQGEEYVASAAPPLWRPSKIEDVTFMSGNVKVRVDAAWEKVETVYGLALDEDVVVIDSDSVYPSIYGPSIYDPGVYPASPASQRKTRRRRRRE